MSRALVEAVSSDGYERKNRAMYVDLADEVVRGPQEIADDDEVQALGSVYAKSVGTFAAIIQMTLEAEANASGDEYPPV
jgi:hypothetical protein